MVAEKYKLPFSVLVVVYTPLLEVLLLERADHPGYWQSVTGSQNSGESLSETAAREVKEETGLDAHQYPLHDWNTENVYEIYQEWRHRYAPGVIHNTERVFGLQLPRATDITVAPREHLQFAWLPYQDAAAKVFSSSNAEAIFRLPKMELEHSKKESV